MRRLIALLAMFGLAFFMFAAPTFAEHKEGHNPPGQENPDNAGGGQEKVTICHAAGLAGTTKYVTVTVGKPAAYGPAGHFYENGTPRAGHEQDYLGPCKTDGEEPEVPTKDPTTRELSTPGPGDCETLTQVVNIKVYTTTYTWNATTEKFDESTALTSETNKTVPWVPEGDECEAEEPPRSNPKPPVDKPEKPVVNKPVPPVTEKPEGPREAVGAPVAVPTAVAAGLAAADTADEGIDVGDLILGLIIGAVLAGGTLLFTRRSRGDHHA